MKKSFIMLAAGALALSACTSSEVVDESVQNSAIGFASHVNKASRAIENASFDQFRVFGSYKTAVGSTIEIFNNISVNKADGAWVYDDPRFWVEDATYTFAAYAVDEDALPEGCRANYADKTLNINGYLADNANQKDIVYTKTKEIKGKATGNEVVALTFEHILSKVNFKFISDFPKGYTVKITNAYINNVRNKGNFIGETMAWANVDRTENGLKVYPKFSNGRDVSVATGDSEAVEVETDDVYVIPFEYTDRNVDIIFDIEVYNGNEKIITREGIKGTWAPKWSKNCTYTYNITISGNAAGLEQIKFTGSVTKWGDVTPATPDFNLGGGDIPQVTE